MWSLATVSTAFTMLGLQKSMVEDLLNSASQISVAMLLERMRLKVWQFPHILAGAGVSSLWEMVLVGSKLMLGLYISLVWLKLPNLRCSAFVAESPWFIYVQIRTYTLLQAIRQLGLRNTSRPTPSPLRFFSERLNEWEWGSQKSLIISAQKLSDKRAWGFQGNW